MKYSEFTGLLTGFINRKDVTPTQIDFFVNTAKNEMQMLRDFNFTRKLATLTYPSVAGQGVALPTDYKSMAGDYAVKFTTTTGLKVPIKGSSSANERRRLAANSSLPTATPVALSGITYYTEWVNEAPVLWLSPEIAQASLDVAYIAWIEDYANASGDREDFLLKYGNQVLLWNALKVQNRFVKEDGRITIDEQLFGIAVAAFADYDARITHETSNLDLD